MARNRQSVSKRPDAARAAVVRDRALGRIRRTRGWLIAAAAGMTAGLAALASALLPGKSLGAKSSVAKAATTRASSTAPYSTPPLPAPANASQLGLGLEGPSEAPGPAAPAPAPQQSAPAPEQSAPTPQVAPAPVPSGGGGAVVSGGS